MKDAMKKIYAIAAALFLTGMLAQAQDLSAGVGYLYSTMSEKVGNKTNNEVTSGAYLGVSYNIPIVDGLGIAPGFYYSILTGRGTGSILLGLGTGTVKFSEHALNIPLYLNYGMELGHANLFFFAGPTFQFGLSSKYKAEADVPLAGLIAKGEVNNYKDLNMGRFNVYMGGGIGVDLNEILRITVGFDYGLVNLNKNGTGDKSNRYNLKIGVGYLFD